MARPKKDATATTENATVKNRISTKDKARKHIDRITKRGVVPMVYTEVLTAFAAVGLIEYDEVLELSDAYAATYISESDKGVE